MRTTFPDLHVEIDDLFVADADRIVIRWTASGTQTGELWGAIPPTGKRVHWNGIHVVTVRDGKITDVRAVSNMAAIPEQLGFELRRPSAQA
jgi:predicted ester cyclase